MTLGKKLRALRQGGGLSLDDIRGTVGVSKSYLAAVERDEKKISLHTLELLCHAINFDHRDEELLGLWLQTQDAIKLPANSRKPWMRKLLVSLVSNWASLSKTKAQQVYRVLSG